MRIGSHSNSDRHELYRDDAERAEAKAKDPLPRFRAYCLEKGLSEEELKAIEIDKNLRGLAEAFKGFLDAAEVGHAVVEDCQHE